MDKRDLTSFYVEVIHSILDIYNKSNNTTTKKITNRILNWIIREYKGEVKLYASYDAIKWVKGQGINDNLSNYNWKDQIKKKEKGGLGDIGRKKLHLEHIIPISQIIENLFEAKTSDDIQKILNDISVAWITKKQQKNLDKGHKTKRGKNLRECLNICEKDCCKLEKIGKYKVVLYE